MAAAVAAAAAAAAGYTSHAPQCIAADRCVNMIAEGLTLHPDGGQHFFVAKMLVDICHHNAIQACHLLLESHAILSFTLIVQLMEEARGPFINQTYPVCPYLQHCPC